MSKNPQVSVLMTSYNQEKFIEEAVLSVVQQDYKNLQIVVSDDGSTDNTANILKSLSEKYPQILEVYLHDENRGSTVNYNHSLSKCKGEYTCYLDGDDIMFPGKISQQLSFMNSHPELSLSYHNVEVFDSDNPQQFYLWNERFGSKTGTVKDIIRYGNYLPSCAIMFKRNSIIMFNEKVSLSPDWLFWVDLLVASDGRIGYINQTLGRYRRHNNNLTLVWQKKIEDQILTLDIIRSQYPQFHKEVKNRLGEIFLTKSIYLFGENERKKSLKTFFKSVKLFFPNIFSIFRMPIREIVFFLRSKMELDDLLKSLFYK